MGLHSRAAVDAFVATLNGRVELDCVGVLEVWTQHLLDHVVADSVVLKVDLTPVVVDAALAASERVNNVVLRSPTPLDPDFVDWCYYRSCSTGGGRVGSWVELQFGDCRRRVESLVDGVVVRDPKAVKA